MRPEKLPVLLLLLAGWVGLGESWQRLYPSSPPCWRQAARSLQAVSPDWRLPPSRPSIPARAYSLWATTPSSATSSPSTPSTSTPPPTTPSFPPAAPLELLEGDVVEYRITEAQRRKGQLPPDDTRALGVGVINQFLHIHPLCRRSPESEEFFFDEDQDAIEKDVPGLVVRVLSQVWYQQRCIEDRKINPHGEEAEDMYILEEGLSPGCGPAERY